MRNLCSVSFGFFIYIHWLFYKYPNSTYFCPNSIWYPKISLNELEKKWVLCTKNAKCKQEIFGSFDACVMFNLSMFYDAMIAASIVCQNLDEKSIRLTRLNTK